MIEKDRREFNSILTSINEKVADINTKMATTCEKVSNVEAGFKEIRADVKTYTERIVELEKHELSHISTCPQNKELSKVVGRVGEIEKDLEEYRMAKKYPKLVLVAVIVFAFISFGSGFIAMQKAAQEIERVKEIIQKYEPVNQE